MAQGDTYQDLKTLAYVVLGKPATVDAAGFGALFAADAGLQVTGLVSLPQRGDSYEDVSEPTLASGRNEHFNGVADGGTLDIPVKWEEGDEGRELLESREGSNDTISWMEVEPSGAINYFYGRVGGVLRRETTTSSLKGNIVQFRVNSRRVRVAPPAGGNA